MKILYFYQYFSTSSGSWGTRVHDFASEWVKAGHDVTVVTSIYSKSDLKVKCFLETQLIDGIKVKIIGVKIDNKQNKLKRILSFIKYSIISSYYALTLPSDVVIASSGPITIGIPALISRYIRNKPLVFEVRDLWPVVPIDLKIITNPFLIKVSYWLEKKCYSASSLIVALSKGIEKYIRDNHGVQNIVTVTNSANMDMFTSSNPPMCQYSSRLPKKYALYTGNIGSINNSNWLYDAAKYLHNSGRDDIFIVLIGDGQDRDVLIEKSISENVSNFIILDPIPKKYIVHLIKASFVSLVPLKGSKYLDCSSPNKLFESLAAGIPVIQNTNGWIKSYLEYNNVGFTLNADDHIALAEKLTELASKPELLKRMGKNAEKIAFSDFDTKILSRKMLESIIKVAM